ncbi:hypothetical protein ACET3Z_019580 [Daucus carota]
MEIEDLPISLVTYWGGGPISRQVVETPFCSPSSPPESLFSSSPSNDCDLNIDDINILKLISSVDEVCMLLLEMMAGAPILVRFLGIKYAQTSQMLNKEHGKAEDAQLARNVPSIAGSWIYLRVFPLRF